MYKRLHSFNVVVLLCFRGYDFGNHFVEWCYNYHEAEHPYYSANLDNYPSREQQVRQNTSTSPIALLSGAVQVDSNNITEGCIIFSSKHCNSLKFYNIWPYNLLVCSLRNYESFPTYSCIKFERSFTIRWLWKGTLVFIYCRHEGDVSLGR